MKVSSHTIFIIATKKFTWKENVFAWNAFGPAS
jgi:hypothetical protein